MTHSRTPTNTAMVTPIAGRVRRSSAPAAMPSAIANTEYPIGAMPWVSKLLGRNALACCALTGPDHQVTREQTAPPHSAAASSSQPTFTHSHRARVMPWVQAKVVVLASSSWATSGAPQKIPRSRARSR